MSHQQVLRPPGQVQQLAVLPRHLLEQALHPQGIQIITDLQVTSGQS